MVGAEKRFESAAPGATGSLGDVTLSHATTSFITPHYRVSMMRLLSKARSRVHSTSREVHLSIRPRRRRKCQNNYFFFCRSVLVRFRNFADLYN